MTIPRGSKTSRESIKKARFHVQRCYEAYVTQLYLDTMPEYNPNYQYCFATSNFAIPYEYQHVEFWLRAVSEHMTRRRPGHGGAVSAAEIIVVPSGLTDAQIEVWLAYVTEQLRARVLRRKRRRSTP